MTRGVRPPDPVLDTLGVTRTYMGIQSHEAVRRVLDLVYRDCWSVLDVTFGGGNFWKMPLPPGIALVTNNPDESSHAQQHRDFTQTGFARDAFDLVIYDPPHVADGGADGIMANRFGSAKGTQGLERLVALGALEAARVARLGVLVKVADSSHGGEWLQLSEWVRVAVNVRPYCVLHTYKEASIVDPKWTVQRAPRSNGATYLAFRLDDHRHRSFQREYERQEVTR